MRTGFGLSVLLVGTMILPLFPQEGPRTVKTAADAIVAGVQYLVGQQDKEGRWGGDANVLDVKADVSGSMTSLGLLALKSHAIGNSLTSIEKAKKYLVHSFQPRGQYINLRKAGEVQYDAVHWNNSLALICLVNLYRESPDPAMKTQIEKLIAALEEGQDKSGGWGYHTGLFDRKIWVIQSFVTSPCLISLIEARSAGFKVSDAAINSAVKFMQRCRLPDGSFPYYVKPMGEENGVITAFRNTTGELALFLAGHSDTHKLEWAVSRFFQHRDKIEKVRQKHAHTRDTHVGKYGYAPYYFFYSHFFVAQALYQLDKGTRLTMDTKDSSKTATVSEAFEMLKNAIIEIQNDDGSWLDTIRTGTHYSTAMALLILHNKPWIGSK